MLLFRLLLFVAIAYLLYRLWGILGQGRRAAGPPAKGEKVVRCAHCAVHVPRHEAVSDGRHDFCCPAHRDAYLSDSRDN